MEQLAQGTLLPHEILEGRDGLRIHRRLYFLRKFREADGIDAAKFVEAVKPEPLAEKFRREAARFGIGGHALHLTRQPRGLAQLAGGGGAVQLVVGDRGPEEETQPAGDLPVVERAFDAARDGLDAIEEGGRYEDAREHRADRVVVGQRGSAGALVEIFQARFFLGGQGPAPRPARESEHILDVAGLSVRECLHHLAVMRAQRRHV